MAFGGRRRVCIDLFNLQRGDGLRLASEHDNLGSAMTNSPGSNSVVHAAWLTRLTMWRMTHPKVKSIMLLVEAMLLDPPPKSPFGAETEPEGFAPLRSELDVSSLMHWRRVRSKPVTPIWMQAWVRQFTLMRSRCTKKTRSSRIDPGNSGSSKVDAMESGSRANLAPECLPGWIYRRRFLGREVIERTFNR